MSGREQREFDARMACLAEATDFVEAFGAACGIARDDVLRLTLIVEELFTNTVEHGHGGDSDNSVVLELIAGADHVLMHYEDAAPPFDPRQNRDPSQLEAPPEERRVGGLGIHLVMQLASQVDYGREGDRNRLRVLLRRTG